MRAPPFLGLMLLGACADPSPWGPNAPTDPGAPTGAEVEVATALHEVPPAPEAEAEGDHAMMHHPDAPAATAEPGAGHRGHPVNHPPADDTESSDDADTTH